MAGNMARLRRWIDALRQGTTLPAHPSDATVDSALASGIIWLRWTQLPALDSDPTPESLLVYEALELLALCALVDYDNWLRIVTEIWPKEMTFWADAFYPDKFELGVEVHANARGQLSKWAQRAWLVDPAIASSTSSNYAIVRDQYEAALRRRSVVGLADCGVECADRLRRSPDSPSIDSRFSINTGRGTAGGRDPDERPVGLGEGAAAGGG